MKRTYISIFLLLSASLNTYAGDWTNSLSTEARYFLDEPIYSEQQDNNFALGFRSEFDHKYDSGKIFSFELKALADQNDSERDHADIAEFYWIIPADNWDLLLGVNKVFWGVTESAHLVDIINQTNQLEGFDGEDKLGQAMVLLNTFHDWGNLDFYVLPGFRERQYPGIEGRLRNTTLIDSDAATYEASDEEAHIDYAIRWSHTFDIWDLGLSYFDGTSRSPDFFIDADISEGIRLIPFYPLITQIGLDLQVTTESWLWKLEAIDRQADQSDDYQQAAFGFEYTFFGINESDIDLGLVVEYLYDNRGINQVSNPFEDDMLIATRLAFNNVQSTEILAGFIADLNSSSYSFSLEASRRLGSHFKLELESRLFNNIDENDTLGFLKQDSYLQADLTYYF